MLDWQDFLSKQNLSSAPVGNCAVSDLSPLGLIRARGEEMRQFLQGQLTNDITQVTPNHSQLSSYCSPKGRMLASFRILERDGDLLLILPAERLDAILKRLRMFVLMSKVELDDVSAELALIELSGDCASDLLPIDPPSASDGVATLDGFSVIRLPGDRPRFQVLGPMDQIQALWEEASETATPTTFSSWQLLDIRAGIPNVWERTVEAFVPQMANLQAVKGVSFTKGCYTGQEVVARMQYLGKLKRRMYRVRIQDSPETPSPGQELFSQQSASGQGAGRLVSSAPSPQGGYEPLAVVEIAAAEAGGVHLGSPDGPPLEFLDLPYPLN